MLKAAGFLLGNLLAAWVLAHVLDSQVHYPPGIPLRVQPLLPALIMAGVFSLLGLPLALLEPKARTAGVMLSIPASIASAGAMCMPYGHLDGALMGLVIAQNSPVALLVGTGWALVWSLFVFRPVVTPPPPPPAPPREELPVSDQWSGAER